MRRGYENPRLDDEGVARSAEPRGPAFVRPNTAAALRAPLVAHLLEQHNPARSDHRRPLHHPLVALAVRRLVDAEREAA